MLLRIAVFVIVTWVFGPFAGASEAHELSKTHEELLHGPSLWHDEQNLEHHLSDWAGRPVVLTTFYTECKKTCPMLTLAKLKELQAEFTTQKQTVDFLIVTMDPDKDTPEILAKYKKNHGVDFANWHLLQGSEKATRQLTQKMGMGDYWSMDDHILHKFRILYLDPEKKIERVLDWEHQDVKSVFEVTQPSASSQSPDLSRKTR